MPEFKYAGSISHGTMRDADLIPVFLDILEDLDPKRHLELLGEWGWLAHYVNWEDVTSENPQKASNLTNWLFDELNNAAPEGYYFDASEGDGSDYGFWPIKDEPYEDLEYEDFEEGLPHR